MVLGRVFQCSTEQSSNCKRLGKRNLFAGKSEHAGGQQLNSARLVRQLEVIDFMSDDESGRMKEKSMGA